MKSKICIKDNKVGSSGVLLCCCYAPIAGFFESLFTEYKPVWAIIMAPEICKFLFHWQKRTSPLCLCIRDCILPGSQREHRLRPLKMENCSLFSPTHASHSTFVLNTQHLQPPPTSHAGNKQHRCSSIQLNVLKKRGKGPGVPQAARWGGSGMGMRKGPQDRWGPLKGVREWFLRQMFALCQNQLGVPKLHTPPHYQKVGKVMWPKVNY